MPTSYAFKIIATAGEGEFPTTIQLLWPDGRVEAFDKMTLSTALNMQDGTSEVVFRLTKTDVMRLLLLRDFGAAAKEEPNDETCPGLDQGKCDSCRDTGDCDQRQRER